MALEGAVTLHMEGVKGAAWAGGVTRTIPIIEDKRSVYLSCTEYLHPIWLNSRTICSSGRLPAGATQLPFSFDLRHTVDPAAKAEFTAELFETYHGVKIDVEYSVKSEIKVSAKVQAKFKLPCVIV